MRRYLPSIKQYSWILLVCVALGVIGAFILLRVLSPGSVVSSTVLVEVPSASTSANTVAAAKDPTKSLSQAGTYAAVIPAREVLTYVYKLYPEIAKRHYSVDDLMSDVTATPSTTASTITIQVTARTAKDAVLLANDVARGFVAYLNQQAQQQLDSQRADLQGQLSTYEKQKSQLENLLLHTPATTTSSSRGSSSISSSSSGTNSSFGTTGNTSNGSSTGTNVSGTNTNSSSGTNSSNGSSSSRGFSSGSSSTTTTTVADPRNAVYSADLQSVNQMIATLQGQLAQVPATVPSSASVVQLAALSDVTPYWKPYLLAGASGGLGLLAGILLMGLMIFLDDRLRGDDKVSEKLGIAYLGGLSTNPQMMAPAQLSGVSLQEIANIYLSLHLTGILPAMMRAPHGSALLVTSAQSAEGKTSTAVALGTAAARAGRTAVIVDGDLHQPASHLALNMSPSDTGLSTLLTSEGAVDEMLRPSDVPGLWFLPAGTAMDTPALLVEQRLSNVLKQLREKMDLVIIDGPPLLRDATAVVLANMADGAVMVVDVRHDKLPLLLRAKELLTSLSHVPAGVILNRLPARGRNRYYATIQPRSLAAERPLPASAMTELLIPAHVLSTNGNGNGNGTVNGTANGNGTVNGNGNGTVNGNGRANITSEVDASAT